MFLIAWSTRRVFFTAESNRVTDFLTKEKQTKDHIWATSSVFVANFETWVFILHVSVWLKVQKVLDSLDMMNKNCDYQLYDKLLQRE